MRKLALRLRRCEGGYTMVELINVAAILGILAAAFAVVLTMAIRHNGNVRDEITLQTEARAALERFATEFRQAYTGDPAKPPTFPIETVTAGTAIRFLTPDRQQPFHLRRVSYQFSSGRLQRADVTTTDTDGWPWVFPNSGAVGTYATLVDSITNTNPFTFYDANGNTTTTAANVRQVRISLTVRTSGGRQTTFTENVTLRSDL